MAEPSIGLYSNINLGLPAQPPDNFTNEEVRAAVKLAINGIQALLRGIEQYGGMTQKDMSLWDYLVPTDTLLAHQLNRLYVIAGENLSFGSFVHLYDDAGVLKARKANSTDLTKPARGFCNQSGGALTGARTEVIVGFGTLAIAGLAPGQSIFLSTTGGVAATVPDIAAGHLEQFLGFGVATNLAFVSITQGTYIEH